MRLTDGVLSINGKASVQETQNRTVIVGVVSRQEILDV